MVGKICLGVLLIFIAALVFIGCGGSENKEENPPEAADSGIIISDSGIVEEDAGNAGDDASAVESDAGFIEDAGIIEDDAGIIEDDGGIIGEDGGIIDTDGSVIEPDAGPIEENDFIDILAGSFTLTHDTRSYSSGDTVTLAAFKLGRTPVTVEEFEKCAAAGACTSAHYGHHDDHFGASSTCNYGDDSKADHPMNCVDWYGAKEYCEWIGGRLPTEEEWEYAFTHNGTEHLNTAYPWGDDESQH